MVTAIYARVSTRDGRQTTENQLQALRKRAESFGFPVIEFKDAASGSKSTRDGLLDLLHRAEQGGVKVVLVWALDRLTREGISAMCGYLETFKKHGVRVVSIQEPWLDTEGPVSELLIAIFAWVAKQERLRISDRIKAGLKRARSEGKVVGRPKIHKAKKIKWLRAKGMTIREIAEMTGIPRSSVFQILRRVA